jgi:hypothetical protein
MVFRQVQHAFILSGPADVETKRASVIIGRCYGKLMLFGGNLVAICRGLAGSNNIDDTGS